MFPCIQKIIKIRIGDHLASRKGHIMYLFRLNQFWLFIPTSKWNASSCLRTILHFKQKFVKLCWQFESLCIPRESQLVFSFNHSDSKFFYLRGGFSRWMKWKVIEKVYSFEFEKIRRKFYCSQWMSKVHVRELTFDSRWWRNEP